MNIENFEAEDQEPNNSDEDADLRVTKMLNSLIEPDIATYVVKDFDRSKDKKPETSTNTYSKKSKELSEQGHGNPTSGSNYKLFSELEAIYKPGGGSTSAGGGENNQTD